MLKDINIVIDLNIKAVYMNILRDHNFSYSSSTESVFIEQS